MSFAWKRVLLFLIMTICVNDCYRHDLKRRHSDVTVAKYNDDRNDNLPFSQRKFEKMLQKAIHKIILGELSAADRMLLKTFNYSHADIQAIREHEINKRKEKEDKKERKKRRQRVEGKQDIEAFNRKALEDYENLDPMVQSVDEDIISREQTAHERFDEAMKPHVVFQIRHDDSEFDSDSDEVTEKVKTVACKSEKPTASASTTTESFLDAAGVLTPIPYLMKEQTTKVANEIEQVENNENEVDVNDTRDNDLGLDKWNATTEEKKVYKGLEWVHDDVYRVIPEAMETYDFENEETENYDYDEDQIAYDPSNDTMESSGPLWDMPKDEPANNLTAYQRLLLTQRRIQGQKAIEDIKLKVLVMTGRFNHTSNQVQKERLTMFLPTCQIPRNVDPEAWADPFSMNMHFQLNLTANDHIAAARLRIFNLPQENLTSSTSSSIDEDEDEKKIRISVYFYTKALKKHRPVKKRLMDSVVTSLTSSGNHLALDVRQALRYWRRSSRFPHGNNSNHGLLIQVEDQDGRPLKPAAYIQQSSCQNTGLNTDEKAYHHIIPALYVRACSRYVRVINGEIQTYYYCKKS